MITKAIWMARVELLAKCKVTKFYDPAMGTCPLAKVKGIFSTKLFL